MVTVFDVVTINVRYGRRANKWLVDFVRSNGKRDDVFNFVQLSVVRLFSRY